MGPLVLLFSFSLLHLCATQVTPVFVQTGTDLLLDVKEPVDLKEGDLFTWTVGSVNVLRLVHGGKPTISPNYKSRAEFSAQNHSLLLKNVQKRDSGVYRARVSADKDITVAEYSFTVLDPVSGVKLTVKLCSSDSTNVTVICSTEDSLISSTFTCDTQTCSHEGGERAEIITPGASLDVYLKNGSVICNHSNQVSSTRDIQKIEDLCKKPEASKGSQNNVTPIVVAIVLSLGVVLAVRCIYHRRRKQMNTDLPLQQRPTNDAPAGPPPSIYSLFVPPIVSEAPTQPRDNAQPESLYATVEKLPKS
ncbi:SLAM family member 5-like isoform X2 [Labrus bergylta]|uniref:SLAM family member 5-like isoform X2 n=1 Tax=Labrus bergylta TaxID=56723 RepID=UPI0033134794